MFNQHDRVLMTSSHAAKMIIVVITVDSVLYYTETLGWEEADMASHLSVRFV